jgi:outer membrane receptor protein involved in Fe transport
MAVLATTIGSAGLAQAQMLEEVIVTATKRAEGLQDVPIAMSVVSGEKLEKFGVTELDELSAYLPNVHIGETGGNSIIFIRGIGSGNNTGFEQSVGTFIDGVYFGRSRNARAAFLDIERVEVLKGPQSTLFGKNTIAGAINITSAQPEEEFGGYIDAGYETELEGTSVTAMVTGAMSDTVRGRLVAKHYERDGWTENQFRAPAGSGLSNGKDGASQENDIIRGTLVWDATDNLTLNFKAEYGEFNTEGSLSKFLIEEPTPTVTGFTSTELHGWNDPDYARTVGFNYDQSQTGGFPGRPVEDDMDNSVLQLTAEYVMGEYSLRSITAYTEYEFDNCVDIDYASIDFADQCINESHEQFTQEFLLSSPIGQTVEWLAGLYYQDATLDLDNTLGLAWSGLPPVEAVVLGMVGPVPSTSLDVMHRTQLEQNTETWSAFASFTWHITDRFRTIFGLRYSDDEKDIDKENLTTAHAGPGTSVLPDAVLNGIYTNALPLFTNHAYKLDRSEEHTTGDLKFQYDLTDDIMAYFTYATGYKAGGFDTSNLRDQSREFEDETVESIELGMKMTLWDGRARVNMAVFEGTYEDMQVSTFVGAGFIVGNAAESTSRGFEADFEVALTDSVMLNGAFAFLDAEYDSYPDAGPTIDQQIAGMRTQDLSGETLNFSPEFSGNVGIAYSNSLTDNLDLDLGLDVLYSDEVEIAPDNDSRVSQDSYTKVNARIALVSSDGAWSVALVGKNLTDEDTYNWVNDGTLSGAGLGLGINLMEDRTYFAQFEAPRTYEIQARYNF